MAEFAHGTAVPRTQSLSNELIDVPGLGKEKRDAVCRAGARLLDYQFTLHLLVSQATEL